MFLSLFVAPILTRRLECLVRLSGEMSTDLYAFLGAAQTLACASPMVLFWPGLVCHGIAKSGLFFLFIKFSAIN